VRGVASGEAAGGGVAGGEEAASGVAIGEQQHRRKGRIAGGECLQRRSRRCGLERKRKKRTVLCVIGDRWVIL
jgi:hypothetical protein